MQLYIIRHGQSTNNALYTSSGSNKGRSEDPELTAKGQAQAKLVAQFLSREGAASDVLPSDPRNVTGFGLTHLYCSPMVRAVATGTQIAGALDLPLVAWKDLHEFGGIFLEDPDTGERVGLAGKPRSYFCEHYPALVLSTELTEDGWWNRPFEEWKERPERARRVVQELMARHGDTDDRVAMVSHGGFSNLLLRAILDLPFRERDYWFIMNNTGITRIDIEQDRTWVIYTNRTDFLPDDLIT
jgi:2,3-bisphosphoglycerate-dependent phosphoglycerate mutase